MNTVAQQPHLIEEALCEPLFEEELHFQSHCNSFDTTWDLTPPESPVRDCDAQCYDNDYSRISINLEQRDFSPCNDLSSVMWNNGVGAFEIRGEHDWTAPPSPVAFDELNDICTSDIDSYPAFELEHEAALLKSSRLSLDFAEPALLSNNKRKAMASPMPTGPCPKAVCKPRAAPAAATATKATASVRARSARRAEPSPSPFSDSDDPESKRHTHNVLERKRRNELKSSYQELREEIPDLYSNDKTPTGVILNRACEYIAALQEEEAVLLQGIALAKLENARLHKLYD
jgi:hypothetical protein